MKRYSEDEAREILKKAIEKEGSMSAFAEKHSLSVSFVSEVVRGNRKLSAAILATIGLKRSNEFVEDNE